MKQIPDLLKSMSIGLLSACVSLILLPLTVSVLFGADENPGDKSAPEVSATRPSPSGESKQTTEKLNAPVPVAVARDRAVMMHQIYTTTLEVMHDRYFHADRSVVPARAMEDVFENLERETGSKANWISVNLKAMSINHDPSTDFEKQAARELGKGESAYETIDNGVYRRATPIPLHGGCVSCHAGFNPKPSKTPKLAGLVISIPVTDEVSQQP